jgi:hypothetical protein
MHTIIQNYIRNSLNPQRATSSSTKHPHKDASIANYRSAPRHPPLSTPLRCIDC